MFDKLEPGVCEGLLRNSGSTSYKFPDSWEGVSAVAALSQAISLKRIADALEKQLETLNSHGLAEKIVDNIEERGLRDVAFEPPKWREWKGGLPPIKGRVDVQTRSGSEYHGERAEELQWWHQQMPGDIVAWRPAKP